MYNLPKVADEDSFMDAYEHRSLEGRPCLSLRSHQFWELSFWQFVHDEQGVKKKPVQGRYIGLGVRWDDGLLPVQMSFSKPYEILCKMNKL